MTRDYFEEVLRAHTEPSENRAKFFSSISSTSALRAGKFSSEPSGFSSEQCSYPTLIISQMVKLSENSVVTKLFYKLNKF